MLQYLELVALNALPGLVVMTVLIIIVGRLTSVRNLTTLWVVAGVFLLVYACLLAPNVGFFRTLQWNWQGKILAAVVALLAILLTRGLKPADFGLRGRITTGSQWALFGGISAMIVLALAMIALAHGRAMMPATRETLAFQFIMPGIDEELLFRGYLQTRLNAVFLKRWKVLGAQTGWGLPLTAIAFALGHMVMINNHFHVEWAIPLAFYVLIMGLILGWLRDRTASLWPCVIAHNLASGVMVVWSFFVA